MKPTSIPAESAWCWKYLKASSHTNTRKLVPSDDLSDQYVKLKVIQNTLIRALSSLKLRRDIEKYI